MKLIAKNFKGHMGQVILGPLFKLLEAVLELFVPLVMADMIDVGVGNGDTAYLVRGGVILLALAVGGVASALTCQYFAAVAAGRFGRRLRSQVYVHIMRLSGGEVGRFGAGGLVTRVTNDTNQIQTGVNMFIRLGTRIPFLAIGGLAMAFWMNWRIGIIFLVAIPLVALILYIVMRKTLPGYAVIQAGQDKLARLAGENLEGTRVIRAFSRQRDEVESFAGAADDLTAITVRVGRLSAALNPLTNFVVALALVAIVGYGGSLSLAGMSSRGEIIAMVTYMNQILLAMVLGANLIVLFSRALASARRVADLLETEPAVADGPGAEPVSGAPAVAFEGVGFTYPGGGDPALADITFAIQPGQTVGIIGGTGSGKTTLVNLMLRMFDATGGRVAVRGANVRDYTLHGMRANFGLVPQRAALFSGTVRQNLLPGATADDDEHLWQALHIAQAADFVEKMDGGLDAEIREGGKNLSGGQKQRLTIARALVRDPEILILDDASSALDYATDAALRRALRERTGKTTVIVGQRAASIRRADVILVMDDGELAGMGTHEALLKTNAVYREICASQGLLEKEGEVAAL